MAEDKDKQGNELLGQDFLGDMQKNVDSMPTTGLFDKLAKLGAQQRLQPLADQKRFESSYKPLLKMVQDAEDRVTAGMLAHKAAFPGIDDSKLHGGVGDLVTGAMTENNARFKELNRQLAYMSPRNPKYADLVAEIAEINKNSLGLRDQNAKLMEIKNTMNHEDFDIKEMSLGNAPGVKNMYSDIQKGVSDNFQTIDGKLYWVDPNPDIAEDDPDKKISVESIKALAPEMTFGEAYVQHNGMLSAVSDMPADSPNYDQNLHFNVNTMFTEIGDAGVKSLIFDSENSEEDDEGNLVGWSNGGDMFNTSNWFESFYSDLGVTDPNTMIDIRQAIQKNGVTHKITGADGKERKVIDHFRKWYTNELKKVEKSEKGKPKATTNLNQTPGEEPELKDGGTGMSLGGNTGGNADFKNDAYLLESENSMMSFDSAWNSGKESKVLEEINTLLPGLKINNIVEDADLLSARKLTFDTSNSYFDNWNGNYAKELGLNGSYGGSFGVSSISNQGPIENSRGLSDQEAFAEVLRVYQAASSTAPSWIDSSEWRGLSAAEKFDLVARKAMTNDGNWKDYSNWQ